jgi:putative FmdB family regulatory protein
MIYEYACDQCVRQFEVVKAMSESGRIEVCEACGAEARRLWSANIELHKTAVKDAEYYHSLGRVVKNDRERSELIKRYGLVEIGNEKPDRARYHMEKDRKERIRKRWEDD